MAKIGPRFQFHPLSPNFPLQTKKFQRYPFVPSIVTPPRKPQKISCLKENEQNLNHGETLADELSLEIKKFNYNMVLREVALDRSREILFTEVCKFTGLKSDELKSKWGKMNEDDKWVMAKGFVAMWSDHFHPLSARSVKEMVDEYLGKNDEVSDDPRSGKFFPGLWKLFGFFRK